MNDITCSPLNEVVQIIFTLIGFMLMLIIGYLFRDHTAKIEKDLADIKREINQSEKEEAK